AALRAMTVAELRDRYREVFGEPSHSRNKDFLRKKVAWQLQANAETGLSDRALARIAELAPALPARWPRVPKLTPVLAPSSNPLRDPRLPPVGTVLRRAHGGAEHAVTVIDDGFEYAGEKYRSLSKVARVITGTAWNGFGFFGLPTRGSAAPEPTA